MGPANPHGNDPVWSVLGYKSPNGGEEKVELPMGIRSNCRTGLKIELPIGVRGRVVGRLEF